MIYTVSITSQGQIGLHIKIRRLLGFPKSGKALVSVVDDKIVIEPVKDFLELAGSLKTNKKPLSNEELLNRFAEYSVQRLIKKGVLKKPK